MDVIFHPSEKPLKRRRVWELDFLRGVCILMMVYDHFMFDLLSLSGWVDNFYSFKDTFAYNLSLYAYNYWISDVRIAVRIFIVFIFFFISGISCTLSKNNNIRLLKMTLASIILSVVTILMDVFFDMGVTIIFGILHIIALSILIFILIQRVTKNKYVPLVIGIVFIIIGIMIDFNNIDFSFDFSLENIIKMLAGTMNLGADSYGVVPYTGVFLVGAFYGKILYTFKTSLVPLLDGKWHLPITLVGQNTLWVYLLHQPIMFGITLIIAKTAGMTIF